MSLRKPVQTAKAILALLLIATAGAILYRKYTHPHIVDDPRLNAWRRLTAPKPPEVGPWVEDRSGDPAHPPTPLPEAPLARLARFALPSQPLSLSELAEAFPEFRHKPFRTAGFDPLVLPFRYEDLQLLGDRAEANAFSFLLADALDWAPGNYCGRHPYFVFKRDPKGMQYLTTTYNNQFIGREVKYWNATHGVGGVLRRTSAGLAATLEIYDDQGAQVLRKDYPATNNYFDLLGDMTVDAMNFFGEPPSPALAQFLHVPRCQHVGSIIRLGMAAFAPQYSDQEWKLYDQILADDPDFAEVRYWEANQKNWADQIDESERQRQIGLSLRGRLTVSALQFFDPSRCPDPQLARLLPTWEAQAARLVGEDSPTLLIRQLSRIERYHRTDPELVRHALKTAAIYPNNQVLVEDIARVIDVGDAGTVDAEMSTSLCIASWADRYSNGTLSHHESRQLLAESLVDLGRYDFACPVTAALDTPYQGWDLDIICRTQLEAGHYAQAAQKLLSQQNLPSDETGAAVIDAAVAAFGTGDNSNLVQLQSKYSDILAGNNFASLLTAVQSAAAGKSIDSTALRRGYRFQSWSPAADARLVLACQADILLSRRHMLDLLWDAACYDPTNRLYWAMLDGYQRQQPCAQTPAFYRSLAWLYPDDPWVAAVVADWRSRTPAPAPAPADFLAPFLSAIAPYSTEPSTTAGSSEDQRATYALLRNACPWVAADAIHTLLQQRKVSEAQDAALRYQAMVLQTQGFGNRAWAARLVRMARTDQNSDM